MISESDIPHLNELLSKFDKLTWPDADLVEKIMVMLGIHEIVELEFILNSKFERERHAALKMVKNYLPGLISGDLARYSEAKETLKEIYYQVASTDEEASL